MKCHECGGPCRKSDVKKVGQRISRGVRHRNKKARYRKIAVCDFCREDASANFIANVLREEIRKLKKA